MADPGYRDIADRHHLRAVLGHDNIIVVAEDRDRRGRRTPALAIVQARQPAIARAHLRQVAARQEPGQEGTVVGRSQGNQSLHSFPAVTVQIVTTHDAPHTVGHQDHLVRATADQDIIDTPVQTFGHFLDVAEQRLQVDGE